MALFRWLSLLVVVSCLAVPGGSLHGAGEDSQLEQRLYQEEEDHQRTRLQLQLSRERFLRLVPTAGTALVSYLPLPESLVPDVSPLAVACYSFAGEFIRLVGGGEVATRLMDFYMLLALASTMGLDAFGPVFAAFNGNANDWAFACSQWVQYMQDWVRGSFGSTSIFHLLSGHRFESYRQLCEALEQVATHGVSTLSQFFSIPAGTVYDAAIAQLSDVISVGEDAGMARALISSMLTGFGRIASTTAGQLLELGRVTATRVVLPVLGALAPSGSAAPQDWIERFQVASVCHHYHTDLSALRTAVSGLHFLVLRGLIVAAKWAGQSMWAGRRGQGGFVATVVCGIAYLYFLYFFADRVFAS